MVYLLAITTLLVLVLGNYFLTNYAPKMLVAIMISYNDISILLKMDPH